MIVCVCRGASDRDVRAAIDRGAQCLSALEECGIGGVCGSCAPSLRRMIREYAGADPDACPTCCAKEHELASA